MEYNDSQINEKAIASDDYALVALLEDFQDGDLQAYNMLIRMLKRSEPKVEMAVRAYFAEGDALTTELVCQAYYPFVEALCKYKFKGKSPKEIADLTSSVLRELVKNAAKLSSKQSLKNQLYQRICRRYSDYMTSDDVNSFGHQSAEKCGVVPNEALAEVKKASSRQAEADKAPVLVADVAKEATSSSAKPDKAPAHESVSEAGALPKPRRMGANSHSGDVKVPSQKTTFQRKLGVAVATTNEEGTGSGARAKKAPDQKGVAQTSPDKKAPVQVVPVENGGTKSILPAQNEGAKDLPKLKGFPSGSQEVRNSGPYSDRLTKALARLAERDYDTYQIIVKHYFNRYSYQHLSHSLGGRSIVAVGLSLYRGLVELGRQVFGLK